MLERGGYVIEFSKEGCVNVAKDETILQAALASNIPLFHVCGGNAKCSTCRVLVIEGLQYLTPPNTKEFLLKRKMHFPTNVRLACQTSLIGEPVKLIRIIQDETDIGLYVGSAAGASNQQMGEEKDLALFFLDIRNFTAFVESHLAFDVIHIIRKLFSVFQEIIETNGGIVIETAGDGIYATFDCEAGREQGSQSAVQSALSILESLEELNDTYFNAHFQVKFEVGIGIHLGKVISGSVKIGRDERRVVMGLPVNIAARLQNATKEINNSLLVSEDIFELLPDLILGAPSHFIQLKGLSEGMTVYSLGKSY